MHPTRKMCRLGKSYIPIKTFAIHKKYIDKGNIKFFPNIVVGLTVRQRFKFGGSLQRL